MLPTYSKLPLTNSKPNGQSRTVVATTEPSEAREELHAEANKFLGWDHYTSRGHAGAVNCVSASEDAMYIASGGIDGTLRIWKYDGNLSFSYMLFAVLKHEDKKAQNGISAVEAVHFIGDEGPAITGTSNGSLHILNLDDFDVSVVNPLHTGPINDMAVRAHKESWLLCTASEDMTCKVLRLKGSSGEGYYTELISVIQHQGPVMEVGFLSNGSKGLFDDVYHFFGTFSPVHVITCTKKGVLMWTLNGQPLGVTKSDGENQKHNYTTTGMAVPENGNAIISKTGPRISVWTSVHKHDNREVPLSEHSYQHYISPVVHYDALQTGHYVEVNASHDFLVVIRNQTDCEMWRIGINDDTEDEHMLSKYGQVSKKLLKRGCEETVVVLPHASPVVDMKIVSLSGSGSILVSGCENGNVYTWDLDGQDAGETTGECRSLSKMEIMKPVIMLLITFIQVSSFAFGPSIPWRKEVKIPSENVYKITTLDVFDLDLQVEKAVVFWTKMKIVLGFMIFFLVSAVTGLPTLIQHVVWQLERTDMHRKEVKNGQTTCGCMHLLARCVHSSGNLLHNLTSLASSLLVVPVFKACAEAVDCEYLPDGTGYLSVAPTIQCNDGAQMTLKVALGFLCPMYIFLLIPYAVVSGQVKYVQQNEIFDPLAWRKNAERAATTIYLGPMHPKGANVFNFALLDLFAKIILPVVVIETTSKPVLQMVVVTVVGAVMVVFAFCTEPLMDACFTTVLRGSRIFTLCTMSCGLMTAIMGDESRTEPMIGLGVSSLIVVTWTFVTAIRVKMPSPERKAVRVSTDASRQAESPLEAIKSQANALKSQARNMQTQVTRNIEKTQDKATRSAIHFWDKAH